MYFICDESYDGMHLALHEVPNPEEYIKRYPGMQLVSDYMLDDKLYGTLVLNLETAPSESVLRWLEDQPEDTWTIDWFTLLSALRLKLNIQIQEKFFGPSPYETLKLCHAKLENNNCR